MNKILSLLFFILTAQSSFGASGYSNVSGQNWLDPVTNAAALPPSGNNDGDTRVTLNDQSIYVWKSGTSSWIQAATPAATSAITALNTDVSANGPGAVIATIQPNVVNNSKLAQMPTNTIKGNNTGGMSNALDLTVAQVKSLLGDVQSVTGSPPIVSSGGTTPNITCLASSASQAGCLSSADWSTFNAKGSVSSVGLAVPAWLSVSGSPVVSSGTITISGSSQTQNLVLASPNGSSGAVSPRALVGADLPNPSSSSLGGVQSLAAVTSNWIRSISTSGVPSASQPDFTDLTGQATNAQLTQINRPANRWEHFQDFINNSANSEGYTGNTGSGAIQVNTALVDGDHPGVLNLSTGSSTSSTPSIIYGLGKSLVLGGGAIYWETLIQLSALSNGTDTYTLVIGLSDSISGSPTPTNGVYLTYTHGTNSGNWVLNNANNSVVVSTNAASGPSAGAWMKVGILVNAGASLATFSINGSSIGTVSSGFPTNTLSWAVGLKKSAGTSPILASIDYFWSYQTFTTPR